MWEAKGREGRKGREPEIEWANASVTSEQVEKWNHRTEHDGLTLGEPQRVEVEFAKWETPVRLRE